MIHNLINNVSVALCSYNGAKYIEQQVRSIQQQSYPHISEIICVDDRSTDDTVALLKTMQEVDHRIKIVVNDTNLGYIRNFEKALSLCSSPFIALSDQDDIWYPTKVEKLVNAIGIHPMVYSDTEYIDEKDQRTGGKMSDFRLLGAPTSCLNFIFFNGIAGHTMLIRKELLEVSIPFNKVVPHDYWLAFQAAKTGGVAFVDEPLVGYRQHTANVLGGIGSGKRVKSNKYEFFYQRLVTFAAALDDERFSFEKRLVLDLATTLKNRSIYQRIKKVILFYQHRNELLFFKKRTYCSQLVFCIKMFFKAI